MPSMNMPPGWEAKWDPRLGRWYYVNHQTKQTQWEDPRLQVQTATGVQTSVEEDRPIRSNWILNKDIDEVIRIYFPDLTDDEDTKTMVKGLFEAEENDKSMVINSLMEMGFKPGGSNEEDHSADQNESTYQEREEERRQEDERIRREVEAELEAEKKKAKEIERKKKEEQRKKDENENRERIKKQKLLREKRERERKEEERKRQARRDEIAKEQQRELKQQQQQRQQNQRQQELQQFSNAYNQVSFDYGRNETPKPRVPQRAYTPITYNSKLAQGPSGLQNGPDASLRSGPNRSLSCGPDPRLRSGSDRSLVSGPDPSLRSY